MSPAVPAQAQHLGDLAVAFQSFSQSSRRLEDAYRLLQERLRKIDRELIDANERLAHKVDELGSLTTFLNEVLASLQNGLIAVDREGRVTAFNQAAERILGLPAPQALGRPMQAVFGDGRPAVGTRQETVGSRQKAVGSEEKTDLISGCSLTADCRLPTADCLLASVLATGQVIEDVEREIATASGKCLRLCSTVAPIHNSQGQLVGAVEVFSDLTEFRELQERLDRAGKLAALGQMAAQLAHEIRNPLNGIEGFASLLVRDLDAGDPRRQFAQHIVAGARSLNKIVTNMLDFAQPCVPQPRPTSAASVLDEALAFIAEECRHTGRENIALERDFDPEADALLADPDLLRQAAMNLLLNSVQAMADGGTLRVVTRLAPSAEDWIEIRIEDSGPGIPAEVRDKVLEPFFTTKSRGTGLGLAIVQKIARVHGGELALETEEGRGTAAILRFPRGAGCTNRGQWAVDGRQ